MGKLGVFLFVICSIAGLYFLNLAFNVITIPSFFSVVDVPIKIIGGLLLIYGGFRMIPLGKKRMYSNQAYPPRR